MKTSLWLFYIQLLQIVPFYLNLTHWIFKCRTGDLLVHIRHCQEKAQYKELLLLYQSHPQEGAKAALYLRELPSAYQTVTQSCLSHKCEKKSQPLQIECCSTFRGFIWTGMRQQPSLISHGETPSPSCCSTQETQAVKLCNCEQCQGAVTGFFYLCNYNGVRH